MSLDRAEANRLPVELFGPLLRPRPGRPWDALTESKWQPLRKRVWERDKGICRVCSKKIVDGDYDCGHIVDRCVGGPDRISNLVVMCTSCNHLKGVHPTREAALAWMDVEFLGLMAKWRGSATDPSLRDASERDLVCAWCSGGLNLNNCEPCPECPRKLAASNDRVAMSFRTVELLMLHRTLTTGEIIKLGPFAKDRRLVLERVLKGMKENFDLNLEGGRWSISEQAVVDLGAVDYFAKQRAERTSAVAHSEASQ